MTPILSISPRDYADLTELARTAHTPSLAQRCEIILASASPGATVASVARTVGTTQATVRRWQDHFRAAGLQGLSDAQRSGAPRQIDTAQRAVILTLHARGLPSRQIAQETGTSQSSISRIIREASHIPTTRQQQTPPTSTPHSIDQVIEKLVIALFDSLADEIPLTRFLSALETVIGAEFSIMLIFTKDSRKPSLVLSEGLPLKGTESYLSTYYEKELLNGLQEGKVTTVSDRYTREELHKTDFYRQYLVQFGVGYILGIDIGTVRGISGKIRLVRQEHKQDFSPRERAICQGLVPYLRSALTLFVQRVDMEAEKEALSLTVSGMSVGSVMVDADGRILEANPPAQAILKQRDGLFTTAGKVTLHNPGQARELQDLIRRNAEASMDKTTTGMPRAMMVDRPSGREGISLLVRPARDCSQNKLAIRPAALIHLIDPAQPRGTMINALIELFGLTPAEAKVALSLSNGHSIGETAEANETSRNTVRSQVRSIFSKMGVNRQSQLIRTTLISVALFSMHEREGQHGNGFSQT